MKGTLISAATPGRQGDPVLGPVFEGWQWPWHFIDRERWLELASLHSQLEAFHSCQSRWSWSDVVCTSLSQDWSGGNLLPSPPHKTLSVAWGIACIHPKMFMGSDLFLESKVTQQRKQMQNGGRDAKPLILLLAIHWRFAGENEESKSLLR